jgi:hypothetical protein
MSIHIGGDFMKYSCVIPGASGAASRDFGLARSRHAGKSGNPASFWLFSPDPSNRMQNMASSFPER